MKRTTKIALAVFVLLAAGACEDRKAKAAFERARTASEQAARRIGDAIAHGKEAVVAEAKKEAADLDLVIADLKEAAVKKEGEAKTRIDERIRELDADAARLREKLEPLRTAAGESWRDFAREMDEIAGKMRRGIEEVRADLQR
jgi:hypothetical protein